MGARRVLAAVALSAIAGLLVGPGATPAAAHAYLESSTPADGASLEAAPTTVELSFTEHVVLESTELALTDAQGHHLPVSNLRLTETDEDRETPATVVATLPRLGRGAYHLSWRTLSSDDLHQSGGTLAFGVQSAVVAAGARESSPDAVAVAGRWAVLAGIGLVLAGALLCSHLLGAIHDTAQRERQALRVRRVAARGALLAAALTLVVALLDITRFGLVAFTGGYGIRWVACETALVAGAGLVRPGARGPGVGRVRRDLAAALSATTAGVLTVSLGHFGLVGGPLWVVAASAHLVAVVGWTASVALLAWLVMTAPGVGVPREAFFPALRRFRWPAATAVATAVVSGVYLASDVVVSVDAALVTGYGRTLLVKLGLAALVALVALRTSRALHPRRHPPSVTPHRLVVEGAGLCLVVVLGALLASGQPAVAPRHVDAAPPSVIDDRKVADLQQTLTLRPNQPGASVAVVDVLDTRRPAPAPVIGVDVRLTGDGRGSRNDVVVAQPLSRVRWAAGVSLPTAGETSVEVTVHRRGLPDVRSTISWVVGPAAMRR